MTTADRGLQIGGGRRSRGAVPLACCCLLAVANAADIRAVGVLGNSGEAGPGLLQAGIFPIDRCASGAAIDRDLTLWLSGGDCINRVGLNGRLIERFPIEPAGSVVDSRTFAVLNDTLCFLGRLPGEQVALFALPMRSGSKAAAAAAKLPERKRNDMTYCLAPQPLNGQLVIALEPKDAPGERIGVCLLDPASGSVRQAFTLNASYPSGIAVDARRDIIYIGANFGLFVGGETHGSVSAITALRPDGTVVSNAFPAACTKTPAIPTQFRGVISLAGGALWESAWYGFLARLDLEARGAPGRIIEWHHELNYPTQVLGLLDADVAAQRPVDPVLITTPMPDAFYFAEWDRSERQLRLTRRIGCLPILSSLGLSDDGWGTASTARTQLWWRWEDAPDAPPRKAELHVAVTPLFFNEQRAFALGAQYHLTDLRNNSPVPIVFNPRLGDRNEAQRVGERVPMKQPVGLSLQVTPGKPNATVFVTDAVTKQIWRTDFSLPELKPNGDKWQPVRIDGDELRDPTDIVALTDGRLLVADAGRVLLLEPQGEGYRVAWWFERWGDAADQHFGKRLRLAADGAWMLVSDTSRHRAIWLDWAERRVIGQFGQTDKPGDDAQHLDSPSQVALRGARAVVADAHNQRILKLVLTP